jgi:hypothetical protein
MIHLQECSDTIQESLTLNRLMLRLEKDKFHSKSK